MMQMLQNSAHDLRYALRQLRRSPGFTVTAVLTLALGIGAAAAVYSVIDSVLLAPLPYSAPDRLVGVAFTSPLDRPNAEQTGTTADYIRLHSSAFASVAIMDDSGSAVNLSVSGGHAVQVISLGVSDGYFRTLGVAPALGRVFTSGEDLPGGANAVMLSDHLWASLFNRDPNVVGKAVSVNEETFTVVGVMPASFAVTAETAPGVMGAPDVWRPLQLSPKSPGYEGDNWEMIARLRPGLSLAQAQQELASLQTSFYELHPDYKKWYTDLNNPYVFRAWKLHDVVVGEVRRSLLAVTGAVSAVLLVACLNLAGLMLARTMRRSREIALRSSLGATRAQLARLLACEGLVLALGGGLIAVLVARAGTELLLHAAPIAVPNLHGDPSSWLVAAVVLGIALAATAVFSLLPAWFILDQRGREMRLGGPSLGQTASHAQMSRGLIVAQVALTLVLVSAASLLMGTFVRLRALSPGVNPKHLTVFQVTLKGDHYASTQHTVQFVTQVLDRLRTIPGVDCGRRYQWFTPRPRPQYWRQSL